MTRNALAGKPPVAHKRNQTQMKSHLTEVTSNRSGNQLQWWPSALCPLPDSGLARGAAIASAWFASNGGLQLIDFGSQVPIILGTVRLRCVFEDRTAETRRFG